MVLGRLMLLGIAGVMLEARQPIWIFVSLTKV